MRFFEAAAEGHTAIKGIIVTGNSAGVLGVMESIRPTVVDFGTTRTSLSMNFPERLFTSMTVGETLACWHGASALECTSTLLKPQVLPNGIAPDTHGFLPSGPAQPPKNILAYAFRINFGETLAMANSGHNFFIPTPRLARFRHCTNR